MKKKFVVEFESIENQEDTPDFRFLIFTENEDKSRRLEKVGRANSLKLAATKVRTRLLWLLEHPQ